MTTLKATPAASQALYRKRVEDRARVVRGRVEAMPGAGLQAKMDSVDNRIRLLHFDVASELMNQIDDAMERHRQALVDAEMAAAGQAQDQLLAERGVETVPIGSVRTRDGWVFLKTRTPPRLSSDQIATGDRISTLYSLAHRDGLSSCVNDNVGSGSEDPVEARFKARAELGRVRRHIEGATGSERLCELLSAVCGRGETLRALAGNDDRRAGAYEVELRLALDMAGVAFKIGGKKEDAA